MEASKCGFKPKIPRFPAADVAFGPFFGVWRVGSKHGWKHLEKGFKMVSRWPYHFCTSDRRTTPGRAFVTAAVLNAMGEVATVV